MKVTQRSHTASYKTIERAFARGADVVFSIYSLGGHAVNVVLVCKSMETAATIHDESKTRYDWGGASNPHSEGDGGRRELKATLSLRQRHPGHKQRVLVNKEELAAKIMRQIQRL